MITWCVSARPSSAHGVPRLQERDDAAGSVCEWSVSATPPVPWSVARMYDYFLGENDNYQSDRDPALPCSRKSPAPWSRPVTIGGSVVYVDNDPIVLAHGRALLDRNEHTTVIHSPRSRTGSPGPAAQSLARSPGRAPPIGGAAPTRSVTVRATRRPGSPYRPEAAEMLTTPGKQPFLRANSHRRRPCRT
ncbi:SAM-dependent methyltransferase [Streptomyces sp. ISL-99]|uniref:SAM-dependent methyltransferase n=1 Tax=Streptomyces sp. ISL-99 TaxID=2819193 RepID=UPI001BE502C9|nr:SAM-dependent methyltransferase [Streptomyces sp. ISL-99]